MCRKGSNLFWKKGIEDEKNDTCGTALSFKKSTKTGNKPYFIEKNGKLAHSDAEAPLSASLIDIVFKEVRVLGSSTGSFFIFCRHSVTALLKLPLHRHLRSDGKRDVKVTATACRHAYLFRFYYKHHDNFIIINPLHIRLFCVFHCMEITFINVGFKPIRHFAIQKPLVWWLILASGAVRAPWWVCSASGFIL